MVAHRADAAREGHPSANPLTPDVVRHDAPRPVHLVATTRAEGTESLFESLIIDCLERYISSALVADVYRSPPATPTERQVVVQVQAYGAGEGSLGLRISVEEGRRRRALWSGRHVARVRGAPPIDDEQILALVSGAIEAVADALAIRIGSEGHATEAAMLGRIALRKIFSMNAPDLVSADALLDHAFALHPRGIFLAWKIQLRVIQRLERHAPPDAFDLHEFAGLMRTALELEPWNAMVLAAAANAMVFLENDVSSGLELAERSLALNPANPFAWDCLSIARLMEGRAREAHQHQLTASRLAARSPIRHFWDMGLCLTSVVTGDLDSALKAAGSTSVLAPDFRPPLRYLAALSGEKGALDAAKTALERLTRLEDDFSLDQMLNDPAYPVAAMRNAGLLARTRLRDIL